MADFTPTHHVPPTGLAAYTSADWSTPAANLDPGLPVAVLGVTNGWTQVRCSNGWEAWVDGSTLQPVASAPTPGPPPAQPQPAPAPQMSAPAQPQAWAPSTAPSASSPTGFTWAMMAIGVGLAASALFLPWISAFGFSESGMSLANDLRDGFSDLEGGDQFTAITLQFVYVAALAGVVGAVLRFTSNASAAVVEIIAAVAALVAVVGIVTNGDTPTDVLGFGVWASGLLAVALIVADPVRKQMSTGKG